MVALFHLGGWYGHLNAHLEKTCAALLSRRVGKRSCSRLAASKRLVAGYGFLLWRRVANGVFEIGARSIQGADVEVGA